MFSKGVIYRCALSAKSFSRTLRVVQAETPKVLASVFKRSFQTISKKQHGLGSAALEKPRLKRVDHVFSTGRMVRSARLVNEKGWLEVTWNDGLTTQYPYIWLRDNCTCPKCFNPASLSRSFLLLGMDPDIKPANINVNLLNGNLSVEWPDGHQSTYPAEWLEARSFTEEVQEYRKHWHPPPNELWDRNELQGKIHEYDFHELLESDRVLYDWLCSLRTKGIALLKNAPSEYKQIHRVAERVAYLRATNYGVEFRVESKENPSNLAYTPGTLGLHTDQSYYQNSLGMQMLHCIAQVPSEGGENLFVDGFYVANLLRENHPEEFEILTKTIVDHIDIGEDYYKYFQFSRHPTIGLDFEGNVCHINLSHSSRDSFMDMSIEHVTKFYKAILMFTNIMYEPDKHITYKMETGDIVSFHNLRVLHGRTSYRVLSCGQRLLEGGYIDWDELDSKRRVLAIEFDERSS